MSSKLVLPFHLIETQQKPNNIKKNLRYNAFTSKAYAKNTTKKDLGKPPKGIVRRAIQYNSNFKRDYLNGKLPFEIDHTTLSSRVIRLAWKAPIQSLDLTDILPIVIYGLADSVHKYADLAELALTYILEHAHRRQLYQSLLSLVKPFKFVFRSFNKYAITTGLKALQKIISSLYYAGHILIPEYERIMCPLNLYLNDHEEKLCDDIFYGQWHDNYLSDTIEVALRAIEKSANGSLEQYIAFQEIKKAIPRYESEVFPMKSAIKSFHDNKYGPSSYWMKQDHYAETEVKGPSLRLIDINAM